MDHSRAKALSSLTSFFIIIIVSINIAYTSLSMEPSLLGLCNAENAPMVTSPLIQFMPFNYLILVASIANYNRGYAERLFREGMGINDLKRLILGAIVSGGTIFRQNGKYCLRFYGKDLILHNIFSDLSYSIYQTRPETITVVSRGSYITQFYSKEAVLDMLEFSPENSSRSGGVPTIEYILEGNHLARIEAARLIMSIAGWITCSFRKTAEGIALYPRLGLGSITPSKLNGEYRQLLSETGVEMEVFSDNRYPGSAYLSSSNPNAIQSFDAIGNFIEGTRIKKGQFSGAPKNRFLMAMKGISGRKFSSYEMAREFISNRIDGTSLEVKLYLDRIMLG